jgi:hypothetical protein
VRSDERSSELIDDVVLKPAAVCRWIFTLLGAAPGDTLDDLFPARVRWAGREPGWGANLWLLAGKLARS